MAKKLVQGKKPFTKTPEDLMLEAIMKAKPFDAKEAWEEIKRERKLADR